MLAGVILVLFFFPSLGAFICYLLVPYLAVPVVFLFTLLLISEPFSCSSFFYSYRS